MPLDFAEVFGFLILEHLRFVRDLITKARTANTRG